MEKFEALEQKKNDCLRFAQECFVNVEQLTPMGESDKAEKSDDDEKWLSYYMLGKVAEKRKDPPNVVIDHYLKSAQCLYEHYATYPIKISSSNTQKLALEALEVFYRITALIVKYLEQHSVVTTAIGRYFIKVLKQQAKSPFAMNKAKINEDSVNAYKRKISLALEEAAKQKKAKLDTSSDVQKVIAAEAGKSNGKPSPAEARTVSTDEKADAPPHAVDTQTIEQSGEPMDTQAAGDKSDEPLAQSGTCDTQKEPVASPSSVTTRTASTESAASAKELALRNLSEKGDVPPQNPVIVSLIEGEMGRRSSQESTATTTTSESTSSSSESTSTDGSSSDSNDTSSSDDDLNKVNGTRCLPSGRRAASRCSPYLDAGFYMRDCFQDPNAPLDAKYVEMIYEMCIRNLEECVTRFPEHYKSIYRLVHVYLHGPDTIKNLDKCNQLLLGTYTSTLGNQIQGLFTDRKNNNLFNVSVIGSACAEILELC